MELKSKRFFMMVLLTFPLFLLIGCQKEEEYEGFQIAMFSALPDSAVDEMQAFAEEELAGSNMDVKVTLYPPAVERLIIEIIERSGDVIITDRAILPSIHDSEGLHNLEKFRNEENTVEISAYELALLEREGMDVEEGEIYQNALKVINLAPLLGDVKYDEDAVGLTMIVPGYTKHEEAAYKIVEQLAQKKDK